MDNTIASFFLCNVYDQIQNGSKITKYQTYTLKES